LDTCSRGRSAAAGPARRLAGRQRAAGPDRLGGHPCGHRPTLARTGTTAPDRQPQPRHRRVGRHRRRPGPPCNHSRHAGGLARL